MNEEKFYLVEYFIEPFYNEEKDFEIIDKLWEILTEIIDEVSYKQIAYLGLYGSQNYKLNNENSDIDCECFIFPDKEQIIFNKPITSKTINTKYGTCVIKDIRAAFNELRKSSPNVLECFATNYSLVNKEYQKQITDICNNINLYAMLSEYKLLKGFEGLLHRYAKDCVAKSSCKLYANFLRISECIKHIIEDDMWYFSSLLVPSEYDYIQWVKHNSNFKVVFNKDYFNEVYFEIETKLKKYFNIHEMTCIATIQDEINTKQKELITKYIKLTF